MKKTFLDRVYDHDKRFDPRALYDEWSASYDDEVTSQGYATPGRIADTLARHLGPTDPILDFGCGTGLSGQAMAARGFAVFDGCDVSENMLDQARELGIYRRIWQSGPDQDMPVTIGDYAAIAAVGVISKGAAPPETLPQLVDLLAPGQLIVFSFNDHTFADPRFEAAVEAEITSGRVTQVSRVHGAHLPGIGLMSTVFTLRRE